jgi:hypothetical protein
MSAFWDSYRSAQAAGQAQQNALAEFMQRRSDAEAGNALLGGNYDQAAQVYARRGDVENALKARQYGVQQEAIGRRKTIGAQFAKGGDDRQGAVNAAYAAGDYEMADKLTDAIKALDENQRASLARKNEAIGRVSMAAKGMPVQARAAFIRSNAPYLLANGVNQADLDGFDPSDANLDGHINLSMTVAEALKHQNDVRAADYKERDFNERVRHNKANEATAAGQLGVARGNLGVRQQEYQARKAQGGFGTPGAGMGAQLPDGWVVD